MKKIAIIGAGSWGLGLAITLAKHSEAQIIVWDHNEKRAAVMRDTRHNPKYLPNIEIPANIEITSESHGLLADADIAVFSIPSQSLREVVAQFAPEMHSGLIIVNTAKGIEISSRKRLSCVIKDEILGKYHENIVVLSGPTHAEEVVTDMPSAIVAAGGEYQTREIQRVFGSPAFRVYQNTDIVGVEIGGAVKNCMAIGAGIIDGLGFGDNTKAAFITRCIAEITRYGVYYGAEEKTFAGLTGLGDLIVTCNSHHSRNWNVGNELGKGKPLDEILSSMGMVAEGVYTVKAVHEDIKNKDIDMPILTGIYDVLYGGKSPREVIGDLMSRPAKSEL